VLVDETSAATMKLQTFWANNSTKAGAPTVIDSVRRA
jgi:hypothetical protein